MKIVQALGWYFPESTGGTEVYVSGLARGLAAAGHQIMIAAPRDGDGAATYKHEGIDIFRYPVSASPSRDESAGLEAPATLDRFRRWLRDQAPDLYHQHGWTRGCGVYHLEAARALGVASPHSTCPRRCACATRCCSTASPSATAGLMSPGAAAAGDHRAGFRQASARCSASCLPAPGCCREPCPQAPVYRLPQ